MSSKINQAFASRNSLKHLSLVVVVWLLLPNLGAAASDWLKSSFTPCQSCAETLSCGDQTACNDGFCSDLSCGSDGCGEPVTGCRESLFGSISCLSAEGPIGSFGGFRPALAESGITFQSSLTQFYMGVVSGGVDQSWQYGGHGDYVANIDAGKLVGWTGMFIKLRAEHRFGESTAGTTGALYPSNLAADLPVAESDQLYLTNVLFTQMLSETFGVFFGKLDTLDGDQNAFASGRGVTQFSNVAFVATPIGLRTIPYSTLGAGFVILQDLEPVFTFSALNATSTVGTTGLDELFSDGVVLVPELRLPTNFFGRPGHQLLGATWSSRNYVSLSQDPRIILPNIPIARQSDSWSLYYNFDQFLFVDPRNEKRGWGIFGRAGLADPETNPIAWFISAGVGGNSMIPGRENDTFGAGWYYSGTSSDLAPLLAAAIGGIGDGYGTELFYNIAVTDNFRLTADAQFITPARQTVDSSVLLGMRGVLSF